MDRFTITKPDDCHLHVRSGELLKLVAGHTASQFGRAIIMPNLKPPVTSVEQAIDYRNEILKALPEDSEFQPLMTLYLTAATKVEEVRKVAAAEQVMAFKYYPAGATTNSENGVAEIESVYPVLECMEALGVPLLIHGEVTDAKYDIFDREKIFIDMTLESIVKRFPGLRIVLEHVTTSEAVQYVAAGNPNLAATITPQHLLFNRNAILAGGIHPHFYCLPVLKRETHRQALVQAATSGNPRFFLGTDSAPHLTVLKENSCGCAGCYTAYGALELYAEVFERADALHRLEGFASFYGADFYGLPRNSSTISLQKQPWKVPDSYGEPTSSITPLMAGEYLSWRVVSA